MSQDSKQITFQHIVLEGSAYEVGRLQGEIIKNVPEARKFYCSGKGKFAPQEFVRILKLFEQFCPGLQEELNGFADSLEVSVEDVVYYAQTYLKATPPRCSHLAVLPSLTTEKHVLIGRSYEFSDTMDDLRLCTTRVQGKYEHIGFSSILFGRLDGMNERGLSVTMSAAGGPVGTLPGMRPPAQDGFHFWALLRAILDQCQTVEEAIALTQEFPLCCNLNLIVAHKSGDAALIEIASPHQSIKKIDASTADQFVCSTNHLTQPEMIHYIPTMMKNSGGRYQTIISRLKGASPHITKETIRGILSDPYPKGLCFHYYQEFLGTLWSLIFDLNDGTAEICFGSPGVNQWHTFDVLGATESAQYTITLPLEMAESGFWQQVPAEA
ncbi:choloylglycine hydrolase [Candidatus Vecturithrix granuli]|uniref:Choloylglycine hydrolase n=1 Tax=Vecturithrix granuli TaxID=1499967 RepID=A0A081BUK1_VECG1|nr:choloylglycine hydrolase [Candidatus Vecturithrix granuli]